MNKFFIKPDSNDISEIMDFFTKVEPVVKPVDVDISRLLEESRNVAVLQASSSGDKRLENALEQIKNHALSNVMNLDSARDVLILMSFAEEQQLMMFELESLTEFFNKYNENTNCYWNVATEEIPAPDTLTVRAIFANIDD